MTFQLQSADLLHRFASVLSYLKSLTQDLTTVLIPDLQIKSLHKMIWICNFRNSEISTHQNQCNIDKWICLSNRGPPNIPQNTLAFLCSRSLGNIFWENIFTSFLVILFHWIQLMLVLTPKITVKCLAMVKSSPYRTMKIRSQFED